MSFKSEAANVRGKIAAGTFKKAAPSPFKGFFEQLSAGIIRSDEAKRLEDIATRKENKRIAREVKAKQDKADALEVSQRSLVNLYFTQKGHEKTATNIASVLSIVQDGGVENIIELTETMDKYSTYTPGITGQDPVIDQEAYDALKNTSLVTETVALPEEFPFKTTNYNYETESYDGGSRVINARDLKRFATYDGDDEKKREAKVLAQQMIDLGLSDDGRLTTLKPVAREPDQRRAGDGFETDITPYKSGDTPGVITFTGEKPEDISDDVANIKNIADWNAANNKANAMNDSDYKDRLLKELAGIKGQFTTDPKTSDQSDFFAGLKTDADWKAIKTQIDSMIDGDLKTNRLARYNTLVKLKKINQDILDSNSDQSDFFKGMTTDEEYAAISSVIDSMTDSALKTNRRKIYEQLVAARDKRELENAATADISGFIAGITNEDQWTAKYNEASSMEPGIIKTRYLDELMKIKTSVADDIPKPKFMTETLTKQNIPSFLTEIETAIASLRAIPAEKRTLTQSNTLLAYIDRQTLINVTDKAFIAREEEPQLELTDRRATVTIEGTNSDGDNTPFDLYLTQTKNGNWFDANSGKTYGPNEIVKIGPDSDQLDQAGRFGNQLQATLTKPLGDLRTGTTSMSKTALALDAFVKENPAILTFIGGAASEFMVQLQNELSAIAQALRGRGLSDAQYEEEFINASIAAAENSSVMDNGRIYSQWKALNARHAFSFAKLALESSGQALSNFDYKNAVLINNTGSDYPTYSANIRLQTRIVLQTAADKYAQLLKNPNHNIAMRIPVYKEVWDDTGLSTPLLDYVKDRDPEIIAWANDTAFPVANEPPEDVNSNGNGVGLTEMLNNPVFADSIKVQMERLASEDASESLINGFIQRYGRIAFGDNATAEQLSSLRTALGLGN